MYCPNCNAFNDDNAKYCLNCGHELPDPATAQKPVAPPQPAAEPQQPQADSYQQNWNPQQPQQGAYQQNQNPQQDPYRQSWDPQGQQFAPQGKQPTNVLSIVSIVLSILFGNLISLILAILSLVNFNNYEAAQRRMDFTGAQMYADKSRKLGIAAIVLAVIGLIFLILAIVAFFVFGVMSYSGGAPTPFEFEMTEDFFSAIPAILH